MDKKEKRILLVFFCFVCCLFVGGFFYSKQGRKEIEVWLESVQVQFTGKVISKHSIIRGGRGITICCYQVTYANMDSVTYYNKELYQFLHIKDSVVTYVIFESSENTDSIAFNMKNDRFIRLFRKGILIEEYPLSLNCAYANEDDLKICNK